MQIQTLNSFQYAELLKVKAKELQTEWLKSMRQKVPACQFFSDRELIDSLPIYLASFTKEIRNPANDEKFCEALRIAKEHGQQRAKLGQFSAKDLSTEYTFLRKYLLDLTGDGATLDKNDLKKITQLIDACTLGALQEYLKKSEARPSANTSAYDAKVLAEKVAASKKLLQLTADAIPALIAYMDKDMKYLFVNNAYKSWFDKPTEFYIGKKMNEIVGEAVFSVLKSKFERALKGDAIEFEETAPFANGSRQVHVSFTPDIDPESNEVRGVVSLIHDISEQKAFEDELKQARNNADTANATKSSFLANMSHEIRTPLGAIMGFIDLMKDPQLTRAELSGYVGVVERNSEQLLRLINDILDLAKVEAGRMVMERVKFSLPELISDFSSLMGFKARENGIEYFVEAKTPIPEFIVSDPTRIRQILINVVGNAIKFTEQGSVKMSFWVSNNVLTIEVCDTGRGISEAQAIKLFQPFVQADQSTTRSFGGTGLGLVLTKRLANAMGGDFILKHSRLNEGSIFEVKIKIESAPETVFVGTEELKFSNSKAAKTVDQIPRLNDMKILIVEDSPDNQALLKILLSKAGATLEFASDGFEGVEKALMSEHDLVLMDIQMPKMDGYQALAELKRKGYSTPIIALTAHAMLEERAKAEAKGFSDFATKPIQRENFLSLLEKYKKY